MFVGSNEVLSVIGGTTLKSIVRLHFLATIP